MRSWRAGAASAPIDVAPGAPLEGYAARTAPSTHVLDPLRATALALAVGDGEPVVLVSADVVAVDRALCVELAGRLGLAQGRAVVCATHTHSGPAGLTDACAPSGVPVDAGVRASVVDACHAAARGALATLEDAEVRFGRAPSTGVVASRVAVHGARDNRVSVLAAQRPDGTAIGAVVLVACHPTVLGAASTDVSADLAGAARTALGAAAGTVAAVTGAAADTSTRPTRRARDAAELQRLGRRLAAAGRRALAAAGSVDAVLGVAEATCELPRKAVRPDPVLVRGQAEPCALAAWRVGSSAWLYAACELSARLGHRIEAGSPFRDTAVVGYAGGYAGYVVERRHHLRETYEAAVSPFKEEAADEFVAAASSLLESLR